MILRNVEEKDIQDVLKLIKELAVFEKMEHLVKNTEEALFDYIFNKNLVFTKVVEIDHQIVAFALYFYTYSTFVGKHGIYLEDIYVKKEFRGKGIGTMLFKALAKEALDQHLERFEWTCLNWNTRALDFYKSLGAVQMNDWITHRMDKHAMETLITS